jgi:N-acylneuraminate cytidylyltransferase
MEVIKKVFVSKDSDEIAAVAQHYSAEVIKRPDALASHTASEWLAWQHAIRFLQDRGEHFDVFLSLPTTSPLRAKEDVKNCLELLTETTDMVITVTPSARSPYFNMVLRDEDGSSKKMYGDNSPQRRQDAPTTYDMTTVAYVTRPRYILNNQGLFDGNVKSVIIPKERAVDIDDQWDFIIAETFYKMRNE